MRTVDAAAGFPLTLFVLSGRLELGYIQRTETSGHTLRVDSRSRMLCTRADCINPVNNRRIPFIKHLLLRFWSFGVGHRRIEHARQYFFFGLTKVHQVCR